MTPGFTGEVALSAVSTASSGRAVIDDRFLMTPLSPYYDLY